MQKYIIPFYNFFNQFTNHFLSFENFLILKKKCNFFPGNYSSPIFFFNSFKNQNNEKKFCYWNLMFLTISRKEKNLDLS